LRIRTCENDDVTSLLKGSENTSSSRSLNVSVTYDDVLGVSITDTDGTPSLETDTLILQMPFRESVNLRAIESTLDVLCKGLDEFVKDDDDAVNKSEIVKSVVFLDGIPEYDEVRCNWLVFDTDDEGDDLEVDGSGKDDFGWRGRVDTERPDDIDVVDDCELILEFEHSNNLIVSGVLNDEGVFRTDDLEDCTRIHFEE